MKYINKKILYCILPIAFLSCKKLDHSYHYTEYTSLDRIEINDTIVGPDILSVFPSEDSPQMVDTTEMRISNDTVYIEVVKEYCDRCSPDYDKHGFASNLKWGNELYYYGNSERIEMDFWPVHNGFNYISYLHTSGQRLVKKVFVSKPSYITGLSFDPPNLFSGDTIFLDDTLVWGYYINNSVSYFTPLINTNLFGDTIKDIYGGVCGVNDELWWGALASFQNTNSGTSYGSFLPKEYNTKLKIFLRLGETGNWRVVDDTTINVNFHCVFN